MNRHIYCRFYEVGCDYALDDLGNLTLYRIDVLYYPVEVGMCGENCSSETSRP